MLSRLAGLFGPRNETPETVDHHRVAVATCVLMLEIAHADKDFSEEERDRIQQVLRERFELSEDEMEDLMEVAAEARRESHDLWRFTNRINEACTPAEKQEIIREIWRVVYSDGHLESHEDHLMHRMATLLNLTHRQLIAQKLAVLEEIRE
jgi:uncharacterized tellurite resistance protein B-like protein